MTDPSLERCSLQPNFISQKFFCKHYLTWSVGLMVTLTDLYKYPDYSNNRKIKTLSVAWTIFALNFCLTFLGALQIVALFYSAKNQNGRLIKSLHTKANTCDRAIRCANTNLGFKTNQRLFFIFKMIRQWGIIDCFSRKDNSLIITNRKPIRYCAENITKKN